MQWFFSRFRNEDYKQYDKSLDENLRWWNSDVSKAVIDANQLIWKPSLRFNLNNTLSEKNCHILYNVNFICWHVLDGFEKLTLKLIYIFPGFYLFLNSILITSSHVSFGLFLKTNPATAIVLYLLTPQKLIHSFNVTILSKSPILHISPYTCH